MDIESKELLRRCVAKELVATNELDRIASQLEFIRSSSMMDDESDAAYGQYLLMGKMISDVRALRDVMVPDQASPEVVTARFASRLQ